MHDEAAEARAARGESTGGGATLAALAGLSPEERLEAGWKSTWKSLEDLATSGRRYRFGIYLVKPSQENAF